MTICTSYAFDMPKYVYVQIHGVDKAARIRADKVEKEERTGKLKLTNEGEPVGEFNANSYMGWWVQDEHES